MKDFTYLAVLARQAQTVESAKGQLKIAMEMERLIKSTIAELKIKVKKEG